MAGGTIEKILRLRDEASPALKKVGKSAGTATGALNKAADATGRLDDEQKKAKTSSAALAGFMGGMGAAAFQKGIAGIQSLAAAYIGLGISSIKVGAQMESYQARLSTLLGTADAAKERLDLLFKIGSTTPFELSQLVEADSALEAFGVNAEKWRRPIMDLAGSMGLDLVEAATAVGKAFVGGAGAADILRERGILNLIKLRTGIKATEMSADEFKDALFETFTDENGKIAGGTAKLAGTFNGMLSNLSDAWFKFQKDISDAGLFDVARAGAEHLIELIGQSDKSGKQLAATIGKDLVSSMESFIVTTAFAARVMLSLSNIGQTAATDINQGFLGFSGTWYWIQSDIITVIDLLNDLTFRFSGIAKKMDNWKAKLKGDASAWQEWRKDVDKEWEGLADDRDLIHRLSKVGDHLGAIKDKAEALSQVKPTIDIKVNMEAQAGLLESLGFGPQSRAFDLVLPKVPIVKPPKKTGKSSATKELEALTKQVESLTKKAFPTTQIDESAKLIEALTAARDRARKSRKDDYDALIADAKRARGELQTIEIRKWAEETGKSLDETGAKMTEAFAQMDLDFAAMVEAMRQEAIDRAWATAEAGVGALTDVGGLVGGMGPAGSLVSSLSGVGQQAADTEGGLPAMVKANVEGFVEGIKVLIKEFPRIITDVLPDLIGTLVPELIFALVEASPHIAKAIIIDLPAALTQGFIEAFGKVWKSIKDFFHQLFLNLIPGKQKGERGGKTVLESIGDFTKSVGKGLANLVTFGLVDSKQTGGFVNRTGMHLLHQGEFVQPTSGTIPQSARGRMGGGGGGVSITINTNVVDPNSIDQLGRLLQRHFGSMGRSTLPIFGGA